MRIIIEGGRGEGKTTVAVLLCRMFKLLGHNVTYKGETFFQEKGVNALIKYGELAIVKNLDITVIDKYLGE